MQKKIAFALPILFLFIYYTLNLCLPTTQEIKLPISPVREKVLLLPLDSRPVCSSMVQELGHLAATEVIAPPAELLDYYRQPADKETLLLWLQSNAPLYPHAIISADMLLHGSLLQSRQAAAAHQDQQRLLHFLQNKEQRAAGTDIFSIVPRLLVSDELLPDSWYQFHLMRYSQLLDMTEINPDFYMTQRLLEYKAVIPPAISEKYHRLFDASLDFNRQLLLLSQQPQAQDNLSVIIGQDDASPFGLPHRTIRQLENTIKHDRLQQAFITYGTDEIAALLLTRHYLRQIKWQPKIHLRYSSPAAEFMHMPYMAVSTGAALRNQIQLLNASVTENPREADLILYVHCGDEHNLPGAKQTQEVKKLLQDSAPIALIDLSANFEAEEMLLPHLLKEAAPLNRLSAYAGWNTFSNSSGTALAQSLLFHGELRRLRQAHAAEPEIASLYASNLQFTAERILEDYYYQKEIHPWLRPWLESFGITPTNLLPEDKQLAESMIQSSLSWNAWQLLHKNLGRTPFYTGVTNSYYLRNLTVGVQLPWNRIFEIKLLVNTKTGIEKES